MSRASLVEIAIEDLRWKKAGRGLAARVEAIILHTLKRAKTKGSLTLLLTSDARLKKLNALFRGRNTATNVLSFPSEDRPYLGDVAIAYGVTSREAKVSGKNVAGHALHLAVHGTLHLLGHDHGKPREAAIMEGLEREILAEFGIADPYAPPKPKRHARHAKRHVRS